MKIFNGKKLLILGGSPNEISLVEQAKKHGIYTIVTDYYTDRTVSPAKNCADEAWDISWSDLDKLEHRCREEKVDGVVAGYSEFRAENQILLCERLDLPCYLTMEQLDITRNKDKFKNICRKNGVPVVHEYESPEKVNSYPVIVKPVDRGGSIGISVANNAEELDKAYKYAVECSVCKKVIIENFITDGIKVDVYYAVCDGEIYYLTSNDTINAAENGTEKVVQSSWLFHSVHEKAYLEKVDANMRKLIKDIGVKDGYMFFSSFITKGEFVFFEMGLRLCGGHTYSFLPLEGKINDLDLFITHALTGTTKELTYSATDCKDLKTVVINVYSKAGKIKEIKGFEEAKKLKDCCLSLQLAHVGEECSEEKAILSKVGMCIFTSESPTDLEEDVKKLYDMLAVTGEKYEDLVYDRMDYSVIGNWWN